MLRPINIRCKKYQGARDIVEAVMQNSDLKHIEILIKQYIDRKKLARF